MKKIKIFFKSFIFVFFTYPFNTFIILLFSIFEGIVPASLALIMKNLVDAILVSTHIALQRFSILVILWLCLMIIAQAVSTVLRVVIDLHKLKLANKISEKDFPFLGLHCLKMKNF